MKGLGVLTVALSLSLTGCIPYLAGVIATSSMRSGRVAECEALGGTYIEGSSWSWDAGACIKTDPKTGGETLLFKTEPASVPVPNPMGDRVARSSDWEGDRVAGSSDWELIGTSATGDSFSVDTESVSINGDTRIFWMHTRLKEPQAIDNKIFNKRMSQINLDCAKQTFNTLTEQYTDSKGNSFSKDYRQLPKQNISISPDSMSYSIQKYVCSVKKDAK